MVIQSFNKVFILSRQEKRSQKKVKFKKEYVEKVWCIEFRWLVLFQIFILELEIHKYKYWNYAGNTI